MKKLSVQDVDRCVKQNSDSREMQTKASSRSTDRIPKDISLTLAEIQQKQDGRRAETQADAEYIADIDTLLSIIDTLQAEIERQAAFAKANHRECDKRDVVVANMKAELIKRVRARAAEVEAAYDARDGIGAIPVGAAAQLKRLAVELEAVELTQDSKSSEASHNPDDAVESSLQPVPESESASVHQPDASKEYVRGLEAAATLLDQVARRLGESMPPESVESLNCQQYAKAIRALAASPVQPEVSKEQDNAKS